MLVLAFGISTLALSAKNTDPKILNAEEVTPQKTEVKTEVPCIYCGTCNGKTYCAIGPTCGQALELFTWLCEKLGCC